MPKRGVEEEEVSDGDGKKEESEGRKERTGQEARRRE